ncbi:hypothetical protein HNP81_002311 [Peribacillus huizhouensis]|uniref:Uncharacterized protein n=1 Tax=Peribacillus huizhouensis TaxID=1501239 RepID=A0ABR6CQN7_9BACI|nr:hypothetical protein [Peribacillus huizhouensis]
MRNLRVISLIPLLLTCIIAFIDAKSSLNKMEGYTSNDVGKSTFSIVRDVGDHRGTHYILCRSKVNIFDHLFEVNNLHTYCEAETLHSMIMDFQE